MKGRGKTVGLVVGLVLTLLTRRWWFLPIGLVMGFLFDAGVFAARAGKDGAVPAPPPRDPYAELGVSPEASNEEVEQAWRRRMQEYHPDRVANAAAELRELAGRRASEANAAWETIRRQRKL
jgi:DnaJ-domain-containing protein 1